MNTAILVTGICLLALLCIFKSRIALWLAVCKQTRSQAKLRIRTVKLGQGEACCIDKFIDDFDGWAGSISIKRTSEKTFTATVYRYPVHFGPSDGQALYINGRKLRAHKSAVVGLADMLILRRIYSDPPLEEIRLVAV